MGNNVENVEKILEKLFEYYKAANAAELSERINTSQKTISNWKVRNSISAIKKKCRELGIYNEIFGDLNTRDESDLIPDIFAKRLGVQNGEELMELLKNTQSKLEHGTNERMLGIFGAEIIKLLQTAATIAKENDEKKESFKKQLREWIIDNL